MAVDPYDDPLDWVCDPEPYVVREITFDDLLAMTPEQIDAWCSGR